jgi:hypothetical protein
VHAVRNITEITNMNNKAATSGTAIVNFSYKYGQLNLKCLLVELSSSKKRKRFGCSLENEKERCGSDYQNQCEQKHADLPRAHAISSTIVTVFVLKHLKMANSFKKRSFHSSGSSKQGVLLHIV